MRNRGTRGWASVARSICGHLLVLSGALCGASGTVAWMAVVPVPSLLVAFCGVALLGAVPIVLGLVILWAGLDLLESEHLEPARIVDVDDMRREQPVDDMRREQPVDSLLLKTVAGGATSVEIANKLRFADVRDVERRLDALVVRDVLVLDLTEDGELVYRHAEQLGFDDKRREQPVDAERR